MTAQQQTRSTKRSSTARRSGSANGRSTHKAASRALPATGILAAAGVALAAGAAFYFRRELMNLLGLSAAKIAPEIREQLPIAKDLKTIPDQEGNYDIDGVSFDSEGVVVSSDEEPKSQQQVQH